MKFLPALVLAVTAVASAAAGAETVISSQDAQARRDRNVDEALARYRATHGTPDGQAAAPRQDGVRAKTHRAADSVRGFTHRQAEKARDFSARQNAKHGSSTQPNTNPEDGVQRR